MSDTDGHTTSCTHISLILFHSVSNLDKCVYSDHPVASVDAASQRVVCQDNEMCHNSVVVQGSSMIRYSFGCENKHVSWQRPDIDLAEWICIYTYVQFDQIFMIDWNICYWNLQKLWIWVWYSCRVHVWHNTYVEGSVWSDTHHVAVWQNTYSRSVWSDIHVTVWQNTYVQFDQIFMWMYHKKRTFSLIRYSCECITKHVRSVWSDIHWMYG